MDNKLINLKAREALQALIELAELDREGYFSLSYIDNTAQITYQKERKGYFHSCFYSFVEDNVVADLMKEDSDV